MTEHIIAEFIDLLQRVPWWQILVITFVNSYVENIFPLSPSDVILVFIGTLVGVGAVDFPSTVIAATAGSVLGFITMFLVGRRVDRKVVESGRYKFIPTEAIHTVEAWFRRWGYLVIVVNRFLSGTRAVISFLAGMSEMRLVPSTIYCALSALAWNCLIIVAGMQLGKNWRDIESILQSYSEVVGGALVLLAAFFIIRWYRKKKSTTSVQ